MLRSPLLWKVFSVSLLVSVLGCACGDSGKKDDTQANPGNNVYVDATAPPGGNGTQTAPLNSLEEALRTGAINLILAPGTYTAPAQLSRETALTITGTSPDQVFLRGEGSATWTSTSNLNLSGATLLFSLDLQAAKTTLSDLNFVGDDANLSIHDGSSASLINLNLSSGQGVEIRDFASVEGKSLELMGAARGLKVLRVENADISNSHIADTTGPGMYLEDTTAALEDVNITNATGPEDAPAEGDALFVRRGSVTFKKGTLSGASDRVVSAHNAELTLEEISINGGKSAGLGLEEGASVTLLKSQITGGQVCLFASESTLRVEEGQISQCGNIGALISRASTLLLQRSTMENCPGGHISLQAASATVENSTFQNASATCIAISNTEEEVQLLHNQISSCVGQGISALNTTSIIARGNTISQISPDPTFQVADGIGLVDSTATLEQNMISDLDGRGISLLRSTGNLTKNTISGTRDGGISLLDPSTARVEIAENTIQNVNKVGILAFNQEINVRNNQISGVLFDAGEGLGDGIVFGMNTDANVQGNTISGSGANGIVYLDGARGIVEDNTLSENRQYGIREFCITPEATNAVALNRNIFDNNGQGEARSCQE